MDTGFDVESFNSKMVRLKADSKKSILSDHARFNSKMVRLKALPTKIN